MNTKDGYAKKSLTSARLLTADGGDTDNYLPLTGGTMTGALVTTALSVSGAATFSQAINGSILGNAATASRLQNARTISLTGAITGSGSFDGSSNLSIATTASSIALGNLSNVSISNPVTGNVLIYNGTNWVNGAGSSSASALSGLTDVSLSSLTSGNILTYDGTNWINSNSINVSVNQVKYTFTKTSNTCSFTYSDSLNQLSVEGNNGTIYCSNFLYYKERGHISFTIYSYSSAGMTPSNSDYIIINIDNYQQAPPVYIKLYFDDTGEQFTYTLITHINNTNITSTWHLGDEFAFEWEGYQGGNQKIYIYKNKNLIGQQSFTYELCTLYIHPNLVNNVDTCSLRSLILTEFPIYYYMGQTPSTLGNLVDVNLSTLNLGHILKYNGNNWVNSTLALSDLSNVNISTPTSGQFLKYNGSSWVNSSTLNLNDLSDVNITNVTNGQVLQWDSNRNSWINATVSGGSASQATSWAELGSGTNGTSQPTLSVGDPFPNSGASADNLPDYLYYPESNKYCALPVIIDSNGQLFVAISSSLAQLVEDDGWRSISSEK